MGRSQQQKNIISQQNIQLIEQIGEGEFGTGRFSLGFLEDHFSGFLVFKAFWKSKQNELVRPTSSTILTFLFRIQLTVAVKRLHKLDQEFGLDDILKEICVLQDIEHTHIIQFFGIVIQTDGLFMLVRHCPKNGRGEERFVLGNGVCTFAVFV